MKILIKLTLFFLILTGVVNAQTRTENISPDEAIFMGEDPQLRAEEIMRAFAAAYPRQIERVEFRNDDWAFLLRGTWFYFAEGKILAESQLRNRANFTRMSFYHYPAELPPWAPPTPAFAAQIRQWDQNRTRNPSRRSPLFQDTLWRIHSREEASRRLQTFHFFGRRIFIHYLIMENLALVEQEIITAARTDSQVQAWVTAVENANNYNMEAFYWRDIAATQSRSLHSYGLAIDIYPKQLGNRQTYWMWSSQANLTWWNVPYSQRYHPPNAVIKAFEKFGFIWGGKWLQFDTMHFEYRPEILILNGMPPEMRR